MEEIIPMIEHSWKYLSEKSRYDFLLINADVSTPANHLPDFLSSDLIVVTCFNTKIAWFIKVLREKLNIDTRLFFYLHGLATISLWPLQRFGILSLLTSRDLFIGSCEGDLKSMALSFTNAETLKVPFTIINSPVVSKKCEESCPFVFIGRISPQKNLDLLIKAYGHLDDSCKKDHPLIFYGEEDHLGFPNIGIKENFYLEKLKTLVNELQLEKSVVFKGYVNRLKIEEELGNNYIFVSPSTHSDENFGMAAFRALLSGVPCVLSAWGGHSEFRKEYSDQIYFIEPYLTPDGPSLNIFEFTRALILATANTKRKKTAWAESFSLETICHLLEKGMNNLHSKSEGLQATPLALTIFDQQKYFERNNEIQQCFKSFDDPAFVLFFKAYCN